MPRQGTDAIDEEAEPAAAGHAGAAGLEILDDDSEIAVPSPRSREDADHSSQRSRLASRGGRVPVWAWIDRGGSAGDASGGPSLAEGPNG